MKRFFCLLMMLFVVFAPCAYADGIPIFDVTQAIIPFVNNVGETTTVRLTRCVRSASDGPVTS
jgi:hypothetical protein